MKLPEMDTADMIIVMLAMFASWAVFYYTIKHAVINAILQTRDKSSPYTPTWVDPALNEQQMAQKKQYERSEISFET
jgi:hypothetical protein